MTRWVGVTDASLNRVLGNPPGTRYLPLTGGTLTGQLVVPSGTGSTSGVAFGAFGSLKFSADGVALLTNNAGTSFTKVQLGGTSSGFCAIEGTATALKVGLADASTWQRIQAGQYEVRTDAGYTAGGASDMYVGFGSSTVRLFPGSGVPTLSIAKGSLYLKADGIGQPYYNNNATTGYTELIGAIAVNVVSPTSPNRTISINIGGTNYFLAAKTTND